MESGGTDAIGWSVVRSVTANISSIGRYTGQSIQQQQQQQRTVAESDASLGDVGYFLNLLAAKNKLWRLLYAIDVKNID